MLVFKHAPLNECHLHTRERDCAPGKSWRERLGPRLWLPGAQPPDATRQGPGSDGSVRTKVQGKWQAHLAGLSHLCPRGWPPAL